MKLSMGSWSFAFGPYAADPVPLADIARRLSKAGYDGIELNGYPPHVTLDRYRTGAERAGLRRMLDGLGLGISGYSADLGAHNPASAASRQAYRDEFRQLLELCHDIGSPMIRVDTGIAPGALPDAEYAAGFARLAELWRECAGHARDAGVVMCWEFEPGFIFNKYSEVLEMHERVGHPWFRVLFDTAHAYMSAVAGSRQHGRAEVLEGGVAQMLGGLHDRIGAVHVIDSDGTLFSDETSTHVPLGLGLIDWPALAPRLLAVPRVEWWCLDLCFCAGAWEMVDETLSAARRMIEAART